MSSSKLMIAEHLVNQTYPALQDPKILLSAIQNLKDAIEDAITVVLEKAREQKMIPPYGSTFAQKLTAFRMHLAGVKGITPIDFMLIGELQEILAKHESSPMEFRRKTAFVIADEDYRLNAITLEKTKTYIQRTKSLLSRL